jgi:hypothetical protein
VDSAGDRAGQTPPCWRFTEALTCLAGKCLRKRGGRWGMWVVSCTRGPSDGRVNPQILMRTLQEDEERNARYSRCPAGLLNAGGARGDDVCLQNNTGIAFTSTISGAGEQQPGGLS